MEVLIILLLVGFGAYQLLRFNTRAGAEAVRAYLYLEALVKQGYTPTEAAALAGQDVTELDTHVLQQIVHDIRTVHNGKQLPLIGEAYRRGMPTKMPAWYHRFASKVAPSSSVEIIYHIPEMLKRKAEQEQHPYEPGIRDFDDYYAIFLVELKRLCGKQDTELHFVELMGDEPLRRAFHDGVDPLELAAMFHGRHNGAC